MATVTLASLESLRSELAKSKYYLNIRSGYMAPVTLHCSYGDSGTSVTFYIFDGNEALTLDGATVTIHGTRRDGASFGPFSCTVSGNAISFNLQSSMTAVEGSAIAEFVISRNGTTVGTSNFGILVENATFPNGVSYDTDPSVYQDILKYVQSLASTLTVDYTEKIVTETKARLQGDAANASAIDTQKSRIDSIIDSGTSVQDTEVRDIRIGYDNTQYGAAGEAVRGQISDIHESLDESVEGAYNLTDFSGIQIGKTWIGTSDAKRAVEYIPVKSNTAYYVEVPADSIITEVQMIEKAGNRPGDSAIVTTTVAANTHQVIVTSATTTFFCCQYVGSTNIPIDKFDDYTFYLIEGEEKIYGAVDKYLRKKISEDIFGDNLLDMSTVQIGKDWGGGNNANRAVVFMQVVHDIEYYVNAPVHQNIEKVLIIEKSTNTFGGSIIYTTEILSGSTTKIRTRPNAKYFCIQFNGTSAISSDAFDQYKLYISPARTPGAIDYRVREKILTYSNNLVDYSTIQYGKNWTGGDALNRAVVFVEVTPVTTYFMSIPYHPYITAVSLVEKTNNTLGGDGLILSTQYATNAQYVITTQSSTRYICIQFESEDNTLTSTIFSTYEFHFSAGSVPDYTLRKALGTQNYSTLKDAIYAGESGLFRVGGYEVRSKTASLSPKNHTQEGHSASYYDVNTSSNECDCINYNDRVCNEYILNHLPSEEIDFTPDNNFVRVIVGKDDDDTFFIAKKASDWHGSFGNGDLDSLEITNDFVNFTQIIKGTNGTGSGVTIPGITYVKVEIVKQFSDGSYLVALRGHNISANTDSTRFYKMTSNFSAVSPCYYINFNGDTVLMEDEFHNSLYDWHFFVSGEKALITTYGSRNPENDYGRVWYTEDCGETWKQVFQTNNHFQDGHTDTVTQAHTHGVMIDPYDGRLFVLVGENNRNLFWSDKGWDTTDSDWNVIDINNQPFYNFQTFTQVVNGYPFKDGLIFGSDNNGVGCIYRINKLDNGGYSRIESVHEFLPNTMTGTTYCAGEISRRDSKSPLLICETREGAMLTEAENEQLNQEHLARVLATYDGFTFTEIWKDDTYGTHSTYIDGSATTRNFAYCTRGMNAWLLKNGDVVIKYSGRDYYYYGGNPYLSVMGYSNACCKVKIIHNVEKYL